MPSSIFARVGDGPRAKIDDGIGHGDEAARVEVVGDDPVQRDQHRPRQVKILVPDGMVVGLKLDNGEMFERHLVEETIALQPGDLYLLFTDGISEAMNARDDLFGESRLGLSLIHISEPTRLL